MVQKDLKDRTLVGLKLEVHDSQILSAQKRLDVGILVEVVGKTKSHYTATFSRSEYRDLAYDELQQFLENKKLKRFVKERGQKSIIPFGSKKYIDVLEIYRGITSHNNVHYRGDSSFRVISYKSTGEAQKSYDDITDYLKEAKKTCSTNRQVLTERQVLNVESRGRQELTEKQGLGLEDRRFRYEDVVEILKSETDSYLWVYLRKYKNAVSIVFNSKEEANRVYDNVKDYIADREQEKMDKDSNKDEEGPLERLVVGREGCVDAKGRVVDYKNIRSIGNQYEFDGLVAFNVRYLYASSECLQFETKAHADCVQDFMQSYITGRSLRQVDMKAQLQTEIDNSGNKDASRSITDKNGKTCYYGDVSVVNPTGDITCLSIHAEGFVGWTPFYFNSEEEAKAVYLNLKKYLENIVKEIDNSKKKNSYAHLNQNTVTTSNDEEIPFKDITMVRQGEDNDQGPTLEVTVQGYTRNLVLQFYNDINAASAHSSISSYLERKTKLSRDIDNSEGTSEAVKHMETYLKNKNLHAHKHDSSMGHIDNSRSKVEDTYVDDFGEIFSYSHLYSLTAKSFNSAANTFGITFDSKYGQYRLARYYTEEKRDKVYKQLQDYIDNSENNLATEEANDMREMVIHSDGTGYYYEDIVNAYIPTDGKEGDYTMMIELLRGGGSVRLDFNTDKKRLHEYRRLMRFLNKKPVRGTISMDNSENNELNKSDKGGIVLSSSCGRFSAFYRDIEDVSSYSRRHEAFIADVLEVTLKNGRTHTVTFNTPEEQNEAYNAILAYLGAKYGPGTSFTVHADKETVLKHKNLVVRYTDIVTLTRGKLELGRGTLIEYGFHVETSRGTSTILRFKTEEERDTAWTEITENME